MGSSSNIVKEELLKAKKKKNINTSQPWAESGAVSQQQEQTTHAIPWTVWTLLGLESWGCACDFSREWFVA